MKGCVVEVKSYVRSKLGEYLESNGINKSWVARQVDATKSQMNNWCKNDENGKAISTPSVVFVLRLQKVLGIRVEDMFEEVDEE